MQACKEGGWRLGKCGRWADGSLFREEIEVGIMVVVGRGGRIGNDSGRLGPGIGDRRTVSRIGEVEVLGHAVAAVSTLAEPGKLCRQDVVGCFSLAFGREDAVGCSGGSVVGGVALLVSVYGRDGRALSEDLVGLERLAGFAEVGAADGVGAGGVGYKEGR